MSVRGDVPIEAEMLSETAAAAELERRRSRLAERGPVDAGQTVAALSWTIGQTLFASPLADIEGVSPAVPVTPVPGAPAALVGIFGRRGVIHSLFDPGAPLDVAAAGAGGPMILLRRTGPRIAIRVDSVPAVIDIPVMPAAADAGLSRVAVLADGRRVRIVDTMRLIGHLTGRGTATTPASSYQEG